MTTGEIIIHGKRYPMRMTLGATKAIAKLSQKLKDNVGDEVDVFIKMLEILIYQGCAYKNLFESDLPVPEDAAYQDGKYIPISADEIEIALDGGTEGIEIIRNAVMRVISDGNQTNVGTKSKTKAKN